jgi:hypothetical protein
LGNVGQRPLLAGNGRQATAATGDEVEVDVGLLDFSKRINASIRLKRA